MINPKPHIKINQKQDRFKRRNKDSFDFNGETYEDYENNWTLPEQK